MKSKFLAATILIGLSISLLPACRKEVIPDVVGSMTRMDNDNSIYKASKTLLVNNVAELYAAVNDVSNVGAVIKLMPGNYLLDPAYPNGGRIDLQQDMSLIGQVGKTEAVVIDASILPASSLVIPPSEVFPIQRRTGVIRAGDGTNTLEWLTLYNDPAHSIRSLIQTDLVGSDITYIKIAHCKISGANLGVSIINTYEYSDGRTIIAELSDNEIFGNTQSSIGSGVQMQNSQSVENATIHATLKQNHIYGNKGGVVAFSGGSEHGKVTVKSYGDIIEGNGIGLVLLGGFSERFEFPSVYNSTTFEAHGSKIIDNMGLPAMPTFYPAFPGDVYAVGALIPSSTTPGSVEYNTLNISLFGCQFSTASGIPNINGFGAYSGSPAPGIAGEGNQVNIYLEGVSKQATASATASVPFEAAGTNTIFIHQ